VDTLGADGFERAARFYADLGSAPVIIGVSSPHSDDEDEARDFAISVGAAAENLLLAATDRGLGACPLSAPRWIRDRLRGVFGVAEGWEVVLLIVVGYPDEAPGQRGRDPQRVTYLR
jgi:nitroreductase